MKITYGNYFCSLFQDEAAIHIAAKRGYASVVTIISLFGPASILNVLGDGMTPLHHCASHGQVHGLFFILSIYEKLIEKKHQGLYH
jgi:hypothetical protein